MILIIGYGDDPAVRRVVEEAADLGLEHVLADQQSHPVADLRLDAGGGGMLEIGGARTLLDDLAGIYARPLSPVAGTDPRESVRGRALVELLLGWIDVAPCRVASRPSAMHSNASKPYQAQLIAAAGFAVPETIVTDDPAEVREFAAAQGAVVFKSISGVRSIVRVLEGAALGRLEQVRSLPTQFQALVPGTDVRVHVVGHEVFATEIGSDAVDYRYAGRDGLTAVLTATVLPDEIADRCVRLAATLGLPLAGIDLRRTPAGDWVCFEVNPMPGYSFYESHTGQPIAAALVRHLAGKAD
ncbi:MAG: ATP-grasp domain-containing protein [Cellulomonas sp.]